MDEHLPQEASSDEQDVKKRILLTVDSLIDQLKKEKFNEQECSAVVRLLIQKILDNPRSLS